MHSTCLKIAVIAIVVFAVGCGQVGQRAEDKSEASTAPERPREVATHEVLEKDLADEELQPEAPPLGEFRDPGLASLQVAEQSQQKICHETTGKYGARECAERVACDDEPRCPAFAG